MNTTRQATPLFSYAALGKSAAQGYAGIGALLVAIGLVGRLSGNSTLALGVIIVAIAEVLSLVRRGFLPLRLVDFWMLGFIYLYGAELFPAAGAQRVYLLAQEQPLVQGFAVSTFGAVLFGYGMTWLLRGGRSPALLPKLYQRQLSSLGSVLMIITALIASRGLWGEGALLLSRAAMVYEKNPQVGLLGQLVILFVVIYPACFLSFAKPLILPMRLFGGVVALFCVLAVFLTGTRFFLGFQLLSLVFTWLRNRGIHMPRRQVLWLGISVLIAWASAAVMLAMRTQGIVEFARSDPNRLEFETVQSEGLLDILGLAYRWSGRSGTLSEHLFLAYWWIPRALWPDKPTMAGHWLIRQAAGPRYSAGHSVSGGFTLPLMLDFGPTAGVVMAVLYGVLLMFGDRWAGRQLAEGGLSAARAGVLAFGVFFAIRSPITSMITVQGIFLMIWLVSFLLGRKRKSQLVSNRIDE